jgi:hypothetical protein
MRSFLAFVVAALVLSSCSHPAPPPGRWEGTYESADALLAARVEIGADGGVRVSAPDLEGIDNLSADDLAAAKQKLADGLASGWDNVAPRQFDFDGSTFRKPGGIAPQMKWDANAKQMTLVVYIGRNPSVDIPLRAVSDFSSNPWSS